MMAPTTALPTIRYTGVGASTNHLIMMLVMMALLRAHPVTSLPTQPQTSSRNPAPVDHPQEALADTQTQATTVMSRPRSDLMQRLTTILPEAEKLKIVSKDINNHTNVNLYNSKDIKSNNWNKVKQHWGNTQRDVNFKLHVAKRETDSIVQRLLVPCTGGRESTAARPAGGRPHSLTPRDYILSLSDDAMAASRHIARVRTQYRETVLGGISPPARTRVYLLQLGVTQVLSEQTNTAEQVLGEVYIRLARLGHHLARVVVWQPPTGGATIDTPLHNIVEGSVMNLLCGVKVVLESLHAAPGGSILEEVMQAGSLPVPRSIALRYLAVYEVLYKLEELLGEMGVLLKTLTL